MSAESKTPNLDAVHVRVSAWLSQNDMEEIRAAKSKDIATTEQRHRDELVAAAAELYDEQQRANAAVFELETLRRESAERIAELASAVGEIDLLKQCIFHMDPGVRLSMAKLHILDKVIEVVDEMREKAGE